MARKKTLRSRRDGFVGMCDEENPKKSARSLDVEVTLDALDVGNHLSGESKGECFTNGDPGQLRGLCAVHPDATGTNGKRLGRNGSSSKNHQIYIKNINIFNEILNWPKNIIITTPN